MRLFLLTSRCCAEAREGLLLELVGRVRGVSLVSIFVSTL